MKNLASLALRHEDGKILVLDQTKLPDSEKWIESKCPEDMVEIIKALQIRGAPLIGVAAALAIATYAQEGASTEEILQAAKNLNAARPTAVNLMAALDRQVFSITPDMLSLDHITNTAIEIFEEDVALCESISSHGAELVQDGDNILTHCNTGGLATAGIGTALGIFKKAHDQGKKIHVFVDETRPLLQGGRLTTYELKKLGIPYTLICDNMAGYLMQQKKIDKVFLGADRICTNGDFANKVGTYSVAVQAHHHGVPFYSVAPYTTIDFDCHSGKEIPIEQRNPEEVQGVQGSFGQVKWSPEDSPVYNPAFDVTPNELLTGIVLDTGVVSRKEIQEGALKKRRV